MLSQRAQEKIHKYRAGYAAQGMRHAFVPTVVSTSGCIYGDLLRLLYILADKKTMRYFEALGEAVDVDSEAYCWRRSGFIWRMWAFLGLACAPPDAALSLLFVRLFFLLVRVAPKLRCSPLSSVCLFVLSACACSPEVTVTLSSPAPFMSPRGIFNKTHPSPRTV